MTLKMIVKYFVQFVMIINNQKTKMMKKESRFLLYKDPKKSLQLFAILTDKTVQFIVDFAKNLFVINA